MLRHAQLPISNQDSSNSAAQKPKRSKSENHNQNFSGGAKNELYAVCLMARTDAKTPNIFPMCFEVSNIQQKTD